MIRIPVAKIERAVDPTEDRLRHVLFDKEHGRLVATDGYAMIVIPVESGDEDVDGPIPAYVFKIAREMDGLIQAGANMIDIYQNGMRRARAVRPEDAIGWRPDDILARSRVAEARAVIRIDAKRLFLLARRLVDYSDPDMAYGLKLYVYGENDPVKVEPYPPIAPHDDGRYGLLMPMMEDNDV